MSACITKNRTDLIPRLVRNPAHDIVSEYLAQHSSTPKSLLCGLPVELRLMIYRMLLCSDRPLVLLPYGRKSHSIELLNKDVCPSILLTCKLFNQEGTYFLYSENQFSMNAWCLSRFANKHGLGLPIGSTNAGSIKFLKIQYDIEKLADLACDLVEDIKPRHLVLLDELPGLEEIALWRFDERDITHMAACCIHHRPSTTKYFISTVATTSRLFIAMLQDVKENQLKHRLENREYEDRNASSPKIYITDNKASVRLAIKGNSLRVKSNEREVLGIAETTAEIRKAIKALTDH
ncbi:hypothetical protein MMC17_007229 [Xylographa soralifera]|nr:hypothetical protein [Xylographa soralifera]